MNCSTSVCCLVFCVGLPKAPFGGRREIFPVNQIHVDLFFSLLTNHLFQSTNIHQWIRTKHQNNTTDDLPLMVSSRSVFVGADKKTGEVVALKRINTEEEENGFPITALREVKILKALNHPNVVELKEIVTSKGKLRGRLKYCTTADHFHGHSISTRLNVHSSSRLY